MYTGLSSYCIPKQSVVYKLINSRSVVLIFGTFVIIDFDIPSFLWHIISGRIVSLSLDSVRVK